MLNWWLGRRTGGANREDDSDPPETPAPVFAARAFKSAIFGTPATGDDEVLAEPSNTADVNADSGRGAMKASAMSPTKPQGILLTPGTATNRRKTVSFGAGVVDNEERNAIGKSGMPNNCPGKFPSPWTPRLDENRQSTHRTTLAKALEAARDAKTKTKVSISTGAFDLTAEQLLSNPEFQPGPAHRVGTDAAESKLVPSKILVRETADRTRANTTADFDGDMTLDLNEPHSQSGRYWKSEYERYHNEAKAQMKKLVKYKQLAKSYAKKKDDEAIDLGEKLKEEQQKVANMERKISELVARIANRHQDNMDDDCPELMKDLARQTALTVQYKDQVEQFQVALQERDAHLGQQNDDGAERYTSPRTARTLIETSQELKRAREQLAEMGSLRDEMYSLRLNLSAAEKKVSKLQDDNAKLSKDLAKVCDDLDRSERRRQSAEAQNQKQIELLQSIQNDYDSLKELAKSQRRDAEHLLKKRHDQVANLKKEVVSLKENVELSSSERLKKAMPRQDSGTGEYMDEGVMEAAKSNSGNINAGDLMSFETPPKPVSRSSGLHGRISTTDKAKGVRNSAERGGVEIISCKRDESPHHLLDSKIPIPDRSTAKPKKPKTDDKLRSNTRRSTQNALSEIINNADVDNSPVRNGPVPESQLTPSFHERFSNLSLNSPAPALSSTEPFFSYAPSRAMHDKEYIANPRPSMFNIPSSPPKLPSARPRASRTDISNYGVFNPSSESISSMMSSRARTALPPERAAAAKARLEQKNAEKKRAQELGRRKENR